LTDLFAKDGFELLTAYTGADSMLVHNQATVGISYLLKPNPQASLVEENYIPASPEEDLLATDELDSAPARAWKFAGSKHTTAAPARPLQL
jgi:hypothetical protein